MPQMRIAIVAILAAWALFFSLAMLRGTFWLHPSTYALTTDSSLRVVDVYSCCGGRAGIHVGDRVEAPTSLEGRLYLQNLRLLARGQPITLQVRRNNGSRRVVTLTGDTMEPNGAEIIYYFAGAIIDLIFVVVGCILVLLRPSTMTWAFFFYSIAIMPGLFFEYYWLPAWLDYGASVFADVLRSFGFAAFLVFCARVPNGRAVGQWHYLESVAAPSVFVGLLLCNAIVDFSVLGFLHSDVIASRVQVGISDTACALGVLALIAAFWRERGVERNRVGWIIAGFALAFGARSGQSFSDLYGPLFIPAISSWQQFVPLILQGAIPLTVAYAVVRHRAFDVGFVANRTLVYGLFLCAGFAAFALLDVLATKRFANNQFEIGIDVAMALAIGLSFRIVDPRAVRLIDRIFLPERYHAAVALEKLRATLRLGRRDNASANRAIETVAKELLLSSLAVFKRAPDGGFVRYAAVGWPKGTAWHIFAGDSLVQSFGARARVRTITEENTAQLGLPPEPARPTVGMSSSAQTAGASLILVGAHLNGRRPDREEVRGIASLLSEFDNAGIGTADRASQ